MEFLPSYMGRLIQRGDRLGEFIRALGYTEDGSSYPVPLALKENVLRARAEGVDISPLKIMDMGSILGSDFIDAWAGDEEAGEEGAFPMSNRLEWFGHDGAQDHWAGLIVFGHMAMPIGRLYAQSVKSSDTIVGRKMRSNYEPDKIEAVLSDQDKIDHAAFTLDEFTTQLHEMTPDLDKLPYGEELTSVPVYKDYIDEMVAVILASPEHASGLLSYLESIGSRSMASGSFNRVVFARELLDGTQKFWGITPKDPQPSQEEPDDSDY